MADNENIMFSLHVYEQWNHNDIGAYFDELQAQGIPIMVGEYGSENELNHTLTASQNMLTAAQEREIGRIVWTVKADDNNDLTTGTGGHAEHFDGTNEEILTELGQLVWDDLQRTEDLEQLPDHDNPPLELTTSEQGYIILQDSIEGARFSGGLDTEINWEYNSNFGQYLVNN